MHGQPYEIPSIPRETIRSAKAVFGPGNFYIQVGDRLRVILEYVRLDRFAELERMSQTAAMALPLVTFFEYIEGLTDDQAAEAFRTRLDWKYALHLPVNPPFFHQNSLCEFRHRVVADPASRVELQKLVDRLLTLNPPLNDLNQNFEILSLLSAVCLLNRLYLTRQAMQQTLGALAGNYPDWLRQIMLPHWYGRFNALSSGASPTISIRQNELSLEQLGVDIDYLLEEVDRTNLSEMTEMREIKTLRHIWERQFARKGTDPLDEGKNTKWNNCDSCRYFAG